MKKLDIMAEMEIRDRALAVGLVSQPISWSRPSELPKFSPVGILDSGGNQIFYRNTNKGYGAEAYVHRQEQNYKRLGIACGTAINSRSRTQKVYRFLRFASLTAAGPYRYVIVVPCGVPSAVTMAYFAPAEACISSRMLPEDADTNPKPFGNIIVHRGNWIEDVTKHKAARVRDLAASMQTIKKIINSFASFSSLFMHISSRLDGLPADKRRPRKVDRSATGLGDIGCIAALVALGKVMDMGLATEPGGIVTRPLSAATIAVLVYLCRQLVNDPSDWGFFQTVQDILGQNDPEPDGSDTGEVTVIASDDDSGGDEGGDDDSGDNESGGSGGPGRPGDSGNHGRGPLPIMMTTFG